MFTRGQGDLTRVRSWMALGPALAPEESGRAVVTEGRRGFCKALSRGHVEAQTGPARHQVGGGAHHARAAMHGLAACTQGTTTCGRTIGEIGLVKLVTGGGDFADACQVERARKPRVSR